MEERSKSCSKRSSIVNSFSEETELTRVRRNAVLVIQRYTLLPILTNTFPFRILD